MGMKTVLTLLTLVFFMLVLISSVNAAITVESDKMASDRIIKTRSNRNILVYGNVPGVVSLNFFYGSTLLGTNTSIASSYNFTFSIPYDGNYILNVSYSDNSAYNTSQMLIKSRPDYAKYKLSFHLSTSATNDVYRIGTSGLTNATIDNLNLTNTQYSSNLTHGYVCSYDSVDYLNGLLVSLIHSHEPSELDFVNFSTNYTGTSTNYTLELRNKIDTSQMLIAFTQGTCSLVDSKMYVIESQGIPSKSLAGLSVGSATENLASVSVQYDSIQLNGTGIFSKGSYKVCIDKPGVSEGNKPIVNVLEC